MAELERGMSLIEGHLTHIVATLDAVATNLDHLDEVLVTPTEAQIRNQEQFRETDALISNLASDIGQLIGELRSRAN